MLKIIIDIVSCCVNPLTLDKYFNNSKETVVLLKKKTITKEDRAQKKLEKKLGNEVLYNINLTKERMKDKPVIEDVKKNSDSETDSDISDSGSYNFESESDIEIKSTIIDEGKQKYEEQQLILKNYINEITNELINKIMLEKQLIYVDTDEACKNIFNLVFDKFKNYTNENYTKNIYTKIYWDKLPSHIYSKIKDIANEHINLNKSKFKRKNKVVKKSKKKMKYCLICKKDVSLTNYGKHMKTKKHRDNIRARNNLSV